MKKLILCLTLSAIGLPLLAQESKRSVVFSAGQSQEERSFPELPAKYRVGLKAKSSHSANTANKTTSVSSRWYNYGQYLDTTQALISGTTALSATIIWNDTSGMVNYSSGLAHNTMVSNGAILQPQIAGFNDSTLYPGEIAITNSNAYVVDSINVNALYNFNVAKAAVVDTLTISFTYGDPTVAGSDIAGSYFTNPTVLSNYGLASTDTLKFASVRYDSVTNTASGASKYTMKVHLTSAMWGDTSAGGIWSKTFAVPGSGGTGFAVPAGKVLGYTLTFKTGDASYVPNATIENFTGTHTYNILRPIYDFKGTSSVPQFAPYVHPVLDFNGGQFKKLPNYGNGWENVYVPLYAWTSSGAASTLQHSFHDIHVQCPTCSLVGHTTTGIANVAPTVSATKVYPNPASTELNISYTLSEISDVTVSLTNVLGKVVGNEGFKNVSSGTATFNTAKLAPGFYFYTIVANGERSTGRILVAH